MAKEIVSSSAPQAHRALDLDLLRVAAAVAVVWLHVSAQHFIDGYPSAQWTLRLCYQSLVRWCVPVFLMISGALFLDAERKLSMRHLYGRNVLRIVVAFLVWSYVYSFQRINADHGTLALSLLLTGPSHFWYLKMLLGIYIAVPVFREIAKNRVTERYFIIVAIACAFVVPFAFTIAKQHCDVAAVNVVKKFYDSLYINVVAGYSGYFVLGHYLRAYRPGPCTRKIIYAGGAVALAVVVCGTIFYSHRTGKAVNWFINYLTPTTLAVSVAVYVWFGTLSLRLSEKCRRVLVQASRLSFGVYLVHVLYIRWAVSHGIDSSWLHPAYFIPLYTLSILAVSYFTAWVLSKIPYVNRYLL